VKPTDVRPVACEVYFLPIRARVPFKFGKEIMTTVTCVRVKLTVVDRAGKQAVGWGETPLAVQWGWPSTLAYEPRNEGMQKFCLLLAKEWAKFAEAGHPIEVGYDFQEHALPKLLAEFNAERGELGMPHLAALISASAFDIALHDAYGNLHQCDIYATYNRQFMNRDLAHFLESAPDMPIDFADRYPQDYFVPPPKTLKAWHLVGGVDALDASDLTGQEPSDGYPVTLADWLVTDGLTCLKIKLRGNDSAWDYERVVRVGKIALQHGVEWLTADFNCTVNDPEYVNQILDALRDREPRLYGMLLYVEQPFPYDLEANRIYAWSVSARKPLFLDESAHDWKFVRLGRSLGWTGVALKTCKTQSGALLSLCWAKAHGMPLMVQDLSNPMLAQIPHVRLASFAGTIMGVETNGMQFYPEASRAEAEVHPGLYRRKNGQLDLSTLGGPGFGYRLEQIQRALPAPAGEF